MKRVAAVVIGAALIGGLGGAGIALALGGSNDSAQPERASAEASAAVVLNAAPRGKLADEARTALEGQGITVFPSAISQRAAYSHAVIDGRAVHEYEPEGKAAEEIAGLYGNISKLLGLYTGKRKAIA